MLGPALLKSSPSTVRPAVWGDQDGRRKTMELSGMRQGRFDPHVIKRSIIYTDQNNRRLISLSAGGRLTLDGTSRYNSKAITMATQFATAVLAYGPNCR